MTLTTDRLEIAHLDEIRLAVPLREIGGLRVTASPKGHVRYGQIAILGASGEPLSVLRLDLTGSSPNNNAARTLVGELLRRLPEKAERPGDDLGPYVGRPAARAVTLLLAIGLAATLASAWGLKEVWELLGKGLFPNVSTAAAFLGLFGGVGALLLGLIDGAKRLGDGSRERDAVRQFFGLVASMRDPTSPLHPGVWHSYAERTSQLRQLQAERWFVTGLFAVGGIGYLVLAWTFFRQLSGPEDWISLLLLLVLIVLFVALTNWSFRLRRDNLSLRCRLVEDGLEIDRGGRSMILDAKAVKKNSGAGVWLLSESWRFERGKKSADIDLRYLVPEEPEKRPGQ